MSASSRYQRKKSILIAISAIVGTVALIILGLLIDQYLRRPDGGGVDGEKRSSIDQEAEDVSLNRTSVKLKTTYRSKESHYTQYSPHFCITNQNRGVTDFDLEIPSDENGSSGKINAEMGAGFRSVWGVTIQLMGA